MGYYGFPAYVSVAEKRSKNKRMAEKMMKKGEKIEPIELNGSKLATSWWGIAWNKNLKSYADFENRISRGSSYLRHGAVIDLKICKGEIKALVAGSGSRPYNVIISIDPLNKKVWKDITVMCTGRLDSIQELLNGKFPKELRDLFCVQKTGLFPSPNEMEFYCDCPDSAYMCKHVAAVLYGIGAKLDLDPSLFFVLRDVKMDDIIGKAISNKTEEFLNKAKKKSSRVISSDAVAATFGIGDLSLKVKVEKTEKKKVVKKKASVKKVLEKKEKKTIEKKKVTKKRAVKKKVVKA